MAGMKNKILSDGETVDVSRAVCVCQTCGKKFSVMKAFVERGGGKYCSIKCSAHSQKTALVQIKCKRCGKKIHVYPSRVKWGRLYCSFNCSCEDHKTRMILICLQCGKEFEKTTHTTNLGWGKYCSRECAGKAKSGENSYFWKGGSSFGKYCYKFNTRRKKATRAFFGEFCICCGISMGDSKYAHSIHHIDHDKDQGCNGKPFNLVPMCKNCHSKEGQNAEEYKKYINKTLDEGFKWGIWNEEEYIKSVMYEE